ncbi:MULTISPECIES: cupin domain-containing protein [Halorussus]|uniref:cupin domain-containing protein n=1 Tax=Halorussus TaxID=1070314 RepID=UPI00209EB588|nr:cupin domain-containing protein [Halorussus vallis]USZ74866.1 cupin domain-containing protein [Halorussus vallis]
MRTVSVTDAESFVSAADAFRPLSDALGTTDVAVNYYELDPGDGLGFCYHRHHEQEEVFYVQSGNVTFRTENGDVAVEAGELVRFGPGEFQRGTNRSDPESGEEAGERAVVLALGAPRVEDERVDLRRKCPECEDETPQRMGSDDDAIVATCADCGTQTGRFTE